MNKVISFKTFEAFGSSKLNSVYKFVKNKDKFINQLKTICNSINFPISELSDDMFKYLPFRKAETLDVDRSTGIDEDNIPLKWIKFWFDESGESISVTGTSGKKEKEIASLSKNLNDYTILDYNLKTQELYNYNVGEPFYFADISNNGEGVAFLYMTPRSKPYMIQDFAEGSEPSGFEWKKYGKYSWCINSDNEFKFIKPLRSNGKDSDEFLINFEIYFYDDDISITKVTPDLKLSNFALVLDYEKLKERAKEINSNGFGYSDIVKARQMARKDSLFLKIPEKIREENYERYIKKISDSLEDPEFLEDFKNIKKLTLRIFNYNNIGFILRTKFGIFENLIRSLFTIIMNPSDTDNNLNVIFEIRRLVKEAMSENVILNNRIRENMRDIESYSNDSQLNLLKLVKSVNSVIYEKVKNLEIEKIEDIFYLRIMMTNILNSFYFEEFEDLKWIKIFSERITTSQYERALKALDINGDLKSISRKVDLYIKYIKRL